MLQPHVSQYGCLEGRWGREVSKGFRKKLLPLKHKRNFENKQMFRFQTQRQYFGYLGVKPKQISVVPGRPPLKDVVKNHYKPHKLSDSAYVFRKDH